MCPLWLCKALYGLLCFFHSPDLFDVVLYGLVVFCLVLLDSAQCVPKNYDKITEQFEQNMVAKISVKLILFCLFLLYF